MPAESASLLDQPSEIGIQFRRAPREINRGNVGCGERLHAQRCRVSQHAFGPIRACIHMTVFAGLVAEFPHVDLKHCYPGRSKREEAGLIEPGRKRRTTVRVGEQLELFGCGGQRMLSPQQGQRHVGVLTHTTVPLTSHATSACMCHRGQNSFRKSHLTTPKIQGLPLPIR